MTKKDMTIGPRMKRWRENVATATGLKRLEVMVNDADRERVRRYVARLSQKRAAAKSNRRLAAVLATINAPRPEAIDGPVLLACLLGEERARQWRPHVEALLTEVSVEALHDLVLEGVFDFADYQRAVQLWQVRGPHDEWIREMADLSLVRDAA